MNQAAYQAVTKMVNAFPQSAANIKGLLLTYDEALAGVSDNAISSAAMRFVRGDVEGQNKTFAPSIAEFVKEARWQEEVLDLRSRPRLPPPEEPKPYEAWTPPTPEEKARVAEMVERFRKAMPDPEPKPEFDWSKVNERFDGESKLKPEPNQKAAE